MNVWPLNLHEMVRRLPFVPVVIPDARYVHCYNSLFLRCSG